MPPPSSRFSSAKMQITSCKTGEREIEDCTSHSQQSGGARGTVPRTDRRPQKGYDRTLEARASLWSEVLGERCERFGGFGSSPRMLADSTMEIAGYGDGESASGLARSEVCRWTWHVVAPQPRVQAGSGRCSRLWEADAPQGSAKAASPALPDLSTHDAHHPNVCELCSLSSEPTGLQQSADCGI